MKNKEIGYFYGTSSEAALQALELYVGSPTLQSLKSNLYNSKDKTLMWIDKDKNVGITHKSVRPKIYRVIIEEVE